ncbi:M23 family metallopeptidase [Novosphingobium sp. KCTC 2891]|uniref:M23 family metallopeptidase n=1 Tax=Novosphingobium sp. KCTC 2891 TaxID=2989730 RepID=UPI0039B4C720
MNARVPHPQGPDVRRLATVPARNAEPPTGPAGNGLRLIIPVQGVLPEQLVDTYTQARADGARTHDAIDILAPTGTPVLAAADGRVEKLFLSNDGGNTIYVRSPDARTMSYYAHLSAYAPGLAEGQLVRRGQVIGAVGATGNADPATPHLHFAIFRTTPETPWYQGDPVNPYPLLRGVP